MDRALKQRLVGASVLIALAVVVLPMMLGGRPEAGAPETREIEIPPQPAELSFESRRFPVGEVQDATADDQAPDTQPRKPLPQPRPASKPPATDGVEITPLEAPKEGVDSAPDSPAANNAEEAPVAETPVAENPVTKAPEVETPVARITAAKGSRYLVQIASFGSAENANRLAARLRDAGFEVLMDSVESDIGILNRVRIGPFPNEEEAAAASESVSKQVEGVTPRILDLQPQDAAPVTRPADPLVRWVVQVGSFSNFSNSENLVKKLRENGRSAYSETITSAGSSVYRVRVGPFLDRETALATQREVNSELGLAGVVMSDVIPCTP